MEDDENLISKTSTHERIYYRIQHGVWECKTHSDDVDQESTEPSKSIDSQQVLTQISLIIQKVLSLN